MEDCVILLLDERHGILKMRIRGMFIEEPAVIEKRRFPRARFRDPVNYHTGEASGFGGCLAFDISEGGIKVNFNDFLPINTEMILQMKLNKVSRIVEANARVVWVQQVAYSDQYQMGLQFTKSDPISQEEIRSYVKSHQS